VNHIWQYLTGVGRALDVLANALAAARTRGQTISQRAAIARNAGKRWGGVLCALLDFVVRHHCDNALKP
jgi:hypothetical protein